MSQIHENEPFPKMMRERNLPTPIPILDPDSTKSYNLGGKIMLTAIILLFFLVLLMISLHFYARWYLHRARRRHILRRNLRRRRTNVVFFLHSPTPSSAAESRGLDAALLASLPVFSYDPETSPDNPPECAVCLSEFESGETGRILPKCHHSFHTDCIDLWFHSHDTCPLCRAPVEPQPEVVVTVCEPETGSSSGLSAAEVENRTATENGIERRKLSSVTIEIPARSGEAGCESPSSFRPPVSRMLSFKRMLSRERKGSVSPSSSGGACSSAADLSEAERGGKYETRRIGADSDCGV